MAVSIDAVGGIAAIEDAKESAEPGPVNIIAPSHPITRGLKWGINYLNPSKEAKGGLIPRIMGTYEKNEAKWAEEEEAFDAVLRAQDKQAAIDAFKSVWSDKRFDMWVDKYSEDLMLDDFITDVSLPDQDDLISSSAKELVSKIDFYLGPRNDDQFEPEGRGE